MKNRIRRVDVNHMSLESMDKISQTIGSKISKILQKAADDANKIANIYGLKIVLGYDIKPELNKDKE